METAEKTDLEAILKRERYTVDDVAAILRIDVDLIRHAAFSGELPARIIDHHIIDLRRADMITWVAERR